MKKTIETLADVGREIKDGSALAVWLMGYGLELLENKVTNTIKKGYYKISGIEYEIVEDGEDESFFYCVRKD